MSEKNRHSAPAASASPKPPVSAFRAKLRACVAEELDAHWRQLDGGQCRNLRNLVMDAAEEELLEFAMRRANGNQNNAAQILGVSRATLSRKLNGSHSHLIQNSSRRSKSASSAQSKSVRSARTHRPARAAAGRRKKSS